ncbi:copper amine oxidase N-terminal domain-containing protein [Desulfotomaculum sp. 1211_IL3151]|uniref:copper amine oxidase N-terminal domain-containing protein n=1 Tax=Desulfotomaculum sp. 1211_IL3151 TaxID=3084055 RepID=UPI002FD9B36D
MKRSILLTILLLFVFSFVSLANAGTTLTLDKASFLPGPNQKVKVYYTTDHPLFDDAWIGIIPPGVPHGSEIEGDAQNITYVYVEEAKYDSNSQKYVELEVPPTAGNYDIRMYSADHPDNNGIELASTPLHVGMSVPATTTPDITTPETVTPGTTTPDTTTPGTGQNTIPGTTNAPVTIINNSTTINQSTNTTTNNANTNTNISGSTIANSNIASNNKTNQTTTNDNSIKVSQYVSVMVNDQPLQSDVKPFVNADGRTMLPIRAIAEALGADVKWDDATQTATLTLGTRVVEVTLGQNSILVDGVPIPMDTAAASKDGRTVLPLRAVSEAMGADVGWDPATSTVKLNK